MMNNQEKEHDSSISIIRVSLRQVDMVVPLFLDYGEFYGQRPLAEQAKAYLEDGLIQGDAVIFLAVQQFARGGTPRPAGFIQLHPSRSSQLLARRWIINDLYVLPEMRRERIGSKLLDMAKEFALTTGAKDLVLRTALSNTPARALYEAQGWIADDSFLMYRMLLK